MKFGKRFVRDVACYPALAMGMGIGTTHCLAFVLENLDVGEGRGLDFCVEIAPDLEDWDDEVWRHLCEGTMLSKRKEVGDTCYEKD
jgi:hypothetical protein